MASVRKRTYKDGTSRFVVDFKDDRGNRCLKTFESKKNATSFRDKIVVEVEGGRYLSRRDDVPYAQAHEAYLRHCDKRVARGNIGLGTMKSYECALARTLPLFKNRKLSSLNVTDVQNLIDTLVQADHSPHSVCSSVNQLGALCKFAIETGNLKINPVNYDKLSLPRRVRSTRIPPKDALKAILAAVFGGRGRYEQHSAYPNRAVIVTLALFGTMRRGEIVALKWKDIDFRSQVIRIQRSRSHYDGEKSTKTRSGVRSFVMAPPVLAALTTLLAARQNVGVGPEDYVLLTTKGRPFNPTTIYGDHWRPVLLKAGLVTASQPTPYRFHDLRHAAASLLIEQGVSPMHVKTMMGHSSIKTTIDTYGHLFPTDESLKRASERIAIDLAATQTQHDGLSH